MKNKYLLAVVGFILFAALASGPAISTYAAEDLLTKNTEEIEKIKGRLDSLSAEIEDLKARIVDLSEGLSELETDVSTVRDQVTPLQEKTADLEFQLKQKVGDLSMRLGEIERDRAADFIEIDQKNWMRWQEMADGEEYGDFALEVSFKQVEGTPAYYGVLFRYQDPSNYYQFWISDDGHYGLGVSEGGEWRVLLEMDYSEAIVPGEWNRIVLITSEANLSLYANGVFLDDVEDRTFEEGKVAVSAETGVEQYHMKVLFDSFVIERLD